MTVSKAPGLRFGGEIELDLSEDCSEHGQLYVRESRVSREPCTCVRLEKVIKKSNVAYREALSVPSWSYKKFHFLFIDFRLKFLENNHLLINCTNIAHKQNNCPQNRRGASAGTEPLVCLTKTGPSLCVCEHISDVCPVDLEF